MNNRISPISKKNGHRKLRSKGKEGGKKGFLNEILNLDSYSAGTALSKPAVIRAQDPLANDPWVFSAALVTALVAAQAPFRIFKEKVPKSNARGKNRTANYRYSQKSVAFRVFNDDIEPDLTHPLQKLFNRPNPYQLGNQIWISTIMWLASQGECFWVKTGDKNAQYTIGTTPSQVWCVGSRHFTPILSNGRVGELVGWEFTVPNYMRYGKFDSQKIKLETWEVIHFKYPHLELPHKGLSRLDPIRYSIEQEMIVQEYNRAILENGGDPGGILTYDGEPLDEEEEKEYLERWNQALKGASNSRKTAMLSGNMKYQAVNLKPKDLEGKDSLKYGRDQKLAVLSTPPSILGLVDYRTLATQIGQDKNFWDKSIIPAFQQIEQVLEWSFFFLEKDDVVGLFDIRAIEALRAGIMMQIDSALKLCGDELHMPPKVAYKVVGLTEIPDYFADNVALAGKGKLPLNDKYIDQEINPTTTAPSPGADPLPGEDPDENKELYDRECIDIRLYRELFKPFCQKGSTDSTEITHLFTSALIRFRELTGIKIQLTDSLASKISVQHRNLIEFLKDPKTREDVLSIAGYMSSVFETTLFYELQKDK